MRLQQAVQRTRAVLTCCSCTTDPYLNIDAGTMSPFEHGEVFVLDDGGEVGSSGGSASSACCKQAAAV